MGSAAVLAVFGVVVLGVIWLFAQWSDQRDTRLCPRCGLRVKIARRECPGCGTDFAALRRPPTRARRP
jgi:ribosomal protein S27AE